MVARVATGVDLCASALSFFVATLVTLAVVGARFDAAYQPTQWPTDALHFVGVSAASAFVCAFDESGHAWNELGSLVVGLLTTAVLFMAAKSYTDQWSLGLRHLDAVFNGVTTPYWDVHRATHRPSGSRALFIARFSACVACTVFEFVAALARSARFAYRRCGDDGAAGFSIRELLCRDGKSAASVGVGLMHALAVFALMFSAGLTVFVAYPRWVVLDSRHAPLLGALVYFTAPQDVDSPWPAVGWTGVLVLGVACSSVATAHTIDVVLRSCGAYLSYEPYAKQFTNEDARPAFEGAYDYRGYDTRAVPAWFATSSIATHALDLVWCGLGSGVLAVMLFRLITEKFLPWLAVTNPNRWRGAGAPLLPPKLQQPTATSTPTTRTRRQSMRCCVT